MTAEPNKAAAESSGLAEARIGEMLRAASKFVEGGGADLVAEASGIIARALTEGRRVIAFGNGGSAAHAQHLAAELVGRFLMDRQPLPAMALTENSSSLTAIANDYGFGEIFVRQLRAFGEPGDVAVGITTSGGSVNVLGALRYASGHGLTTIGLSGANGIDQPLDCCISFPASETPRVQEGHQLIVHLICELVEREVGQGA